MCGIFGIIGDYKIKKQSLKELTNAARQRGRDSSGFVFFNQDKYEITKADFDITQLHQSTQFNNSRFIMGHSRLATNGFQDNQPLIVDDIILLHNGIIVNEDEIWQSTAQTPKLQIDSEAIIALIREHITNSDDISLFREKVLSKLKGVASCALLLPKIGKLVLFSNNGSMYYGYDKFNLYFSSEQHPLSKIGLNQIAQLKNDFKVIDAPQTSINTLVKEYKVDRVNFLPELVTNAQQEKLLRFDERKLRRCSKCILPETMPFIKFDKNGICNYCHNYTSKSAKKSKDELFTLLEHYKRNGSDDCIVPFSGGRDSCFALHLIKKEFNMNPVTYTYDWGMITDLGRRNISRMCSELGVENIIIADDIKLKRENIRKNLIAWLNNPHLGMLALLTAGDKHFFRHVKTVQRQTGIDLQLWGVNPLEQTYFKAGFLNIKPDFDNTTVYSSGLMKQVNYHCKRTYEMFKNPGYFNSSLWDTLSGEYYRSFSAKTAYYHIFDYWDWNEDKVNNTLISEYNWETASDTSTTWRIGDGTAAFYNYVYYTLAGFSEHDTFRSNQIREGQLSREIALSKVADENRPRYQNIRWYLDAIGVDFIQAISKVNSMPRMSASGI